MDPAAARPSDRVSSVSSQANKAVKGYSTVPSEDVDGATQDDAHDSGSTSFRSRANRVSTGYSAILANDVEPSDVASPAVSGRGSGATGSTAVSRDDSRPSDGVSSTDSDANKTTANHLGMPIDGARTSGVESSLGEKKAATGPSAMPTTGVGDDTHDVSQGHRASRLERVLLDTWIPETVAITISTCCLFAILAVCLFYNNKASPRIPYGITLNALISVLSTISRSMLIFAVAASISQLKWCWFKSSRKLQDLQTFDDASRGPWGSVTLLFYLRARPLASIGAIITILALALDPFIQQILTYPAREVVSSEAVPTTGRALAYTALPYDDPWVNAIEVGIFSPPAQFDRQPVCPTGNCTWPIFESVGWCKKCQDATPYATLSNCNFTALSDVSGHNKTITGCSISFGHGDSVTLLQARLQAGTEDANTLVKDAVWVLNAQQAPGMPPPPALTVLGIDNPVVSLGRISMVGTVEPDQWPLNPVRIAKAEECILSLCQRDYQVTVQNGIARTSIIGDERFAKIVYRSLPLEKSLGLNYVRPCWKSDTRPGASESDSHCSTEIVDDICCPVGMELSTAVPTFGTTIQDSLVGNVTYDEYSLDPSTRTYSHPAARYIQTHSLSQALDGVAASLTRLTLSGNTTEVAGTMLTVESHVHVALYWLALPFVLQAGGVALLILAVSESRRRGVEPWKESLLPVLFNGLESQFLNRLVVPEGTSAMSVMADHIQIKLEYSTAQRKNILKAD